jgi:hypothetical protein
VGASKTQMLRRKTRNRLQCQFPSDFFFLLQQQSLKRHFLTCPCHLKKERSSPGSFPGGEGQRLLMIADAAHRNQARKPTPCPKGEGRGSYAHVHPHNTITPKFIFTTMTTTTPPPPHTCSPKSAHPFPRARASCFISIYIYFFPSAKPPFLLIQGFQAAAAANG